MIPAPKRRAINLSDFLKRVKSRRIAEKEARERECPPISTPCSHLYKAIGLVEETYVNNDCHIVTNEVFAPVLTEGGSSSGIENQDSLVNTIKEFHSKEDFQLYFSSQPDTLMENLMKEAFPPLESPLDIHREDEPVATKFLSRFGHKSFGLQGRRVVLLGAKSVAKWAEDGLTAVDKKISVLQQERKVLMRLRTASRKATIERIKLEKTHIQISRDIVYSNLRNAVLRQLMADGGPTNGEFTAGSLKVVADRLIHNGYATKDDVIVDGGCGSGCAIFDLAQMIGCKAFGIECHAERIYKSLRQVLKTVKNEALCNPKVAYVPSDLMQMRSFGRDATFGYFFDEAFDGRLLEHLIQICCNSPSLKFFLSTKASKEPHYHGLFASYGWEQVDKIKNLTKSGSHERNTAYIYRRTESANDHRENMPCRGFSEQVLSEKFLARAWSDTYDVRVEHVEWMISQMPEPNDLSKFATLCNCKDCCIEEEINTNVLCIGMEFGCPSLTTLEQVVDAVKGKFAFTQTARDTARCLMLEKHHGKDVFTMSCCEVGHRVGRHLPLKIKGNLNKLSSSELEEFMSEHKFGCIFIDYFYMPNGYVAHRFQGLILFLTGPIIPYLTENATVDLPLSVDFVQLIKKNEDENRTNERAWYKHYTATLVSENILSQATAQIPENIMRGVFGKEINQFAEFNLRKRYGGWIGDVISQYAQAPEEYHFIRFTRTTQGN